ncbi:MAG: DUF2357 domain-containing protein [Candidatus Faecousia sp.]|nr:DUF2357 domain-containing protein [Candidatus Faecousia sp.]
MANTINDLYLKYVNKVGKTLENDRYFRYLFEMVQAGNTTLQQTHQTLHKVVDERWLTVIEDSLDALNRITEKPRRFVTTNEEVVPVALARKITADSVRHLSMNTQFIASSKNGDIQPTRILNVTTEETYDLYENRFIYHLIQRLVTFIDKRTDVIFWSTGDETRNTLKMHSTVDDAYEQIEYKLEMTVKNAQSFAENDSDNMQVFMRIDRVRRMVMALRNSSFCEIMAGCAKVHSPIQRTNTIMKDPDYRVCYKLWQFLESYEEVGYSIDVKDSALEFDEEYQLQLFSNLITNYTVFKSILEGDPRKLEEAPAKRHKVIKPRFIKKVEEQIVDDYDIPDVEIRKVIVEEVTQAQLDAEAKLVEETARREAAEAAQADTEKAFEEYRWLAQFQQAEAERQAEDRLNFVKEKAEKERQELQAAMDAARKAAEEKLAQTQAAAEKRQEELQAAMDAARKAAEEKLVQMQAEAERQQAELQAAMDAAQKAAEEKLAKTQADARSRETSLKEAVKAAEDDAYQARYRRREITAALKRAEAALETTRQELEDTAAREQAAIAREQAALQKAQEEAAAREQAEARAAENTLTRRILDAVSRRRGEKDDQESANKLS